MVVFIIFLMKATTSPKHSNCSFNVQRMLQVLPLPTPPIATIVDVPIIEFATGICPHHSTFFQIFKFSATTCTQNAPVFMLIAGNFLTAETTTYYLKMSQPNMVSTFSPMEDHPFYTLQACLICNS